jgi:hypothetical protein
MAIQWVTNLDCMSIPSRIVSFTFAFGSHLIKSMEMSAQTWFGISKGWQKEAWERGLVVEQLIIIFTNFCHVAYFNPLLYNMLMFF